MRSIRAISTLTMLLVCASRAGAQMPVETPPAVEKAPETTPAPSKFRSADDGWLDVSGFLDEKYGFLPVVIPITEPAVGYGAAVAGAFLSRPLGEARDGFGRPDITLAGGLGTQNGSWGILAGDIRHWLDDRLETQVGFTHMSINLDFHGIGQDARLDDHPLHYNLEPTGGVVRTKYRLGDTTLWAGLGYAYVATRVTFDAPSGTPGLPDFRRDSTVAGFTPSLTYDSRDNIFTPLRGTFAEIILGVFDPALGADDEFQRLQLIAIQYVPLFRSLYLGLRGDGAAIFGDAPFYLKPFVSLRGAPIMRYQGDQVAQLEAELRWQFWQRFSAVGFTGIGAAWNDFERLHNRQSIVTGGVGFRYEIARKYGIHMGLDLAFAPGNTAVYVQVGSAWARP
jgi:outer membrane protein assembly factor BamA